MQLMIRRLFVFFFLVLVLPATLWAQPGLQKALQVQQLHRKQLFAIQGVEATGISTDANGNAILKVYLRNGKVAGVPAALGGVGVQKFVSGPINAWPDMKAQRGKPGGNGGGSSPTDRFERAVPIGVSLGTYKYGESNYCFAGTLGCRLKANLPNGSVAYYILSNNHVIADQNGGNINSDAIIQPGTLDNNCTFEAEDIVGQLSNFVEIDFAGDNYVDAAIASTTTDMVGVATPTDGYGTPTAALEDASVGLLVKKYGRTTGYTEGYVDSIHVEVNVGYDGGTAHFVDQVLIIGQTQRGKKLVNSAFSDSGDSGSLIVTQEGNHPTALLFAGNSTVTVGNPIDAVLSEFSTQLQAVVQVDDGN